MRDSPLQFKELGILYILDQGGSWINIMSKWEWVLSIVLMMREFLQTFCENILKFHIYSLLASK